MATRNLTEHCPVCGAPVRVQSSDEETRGYGPLARVVYDPDADELEIVFRSEPAETIPIDDQIYLRLEVVTGRLVGIMIQNFRAWLENGTETMQHADT